jgi:3-hydroxyacyl-[acyl-carrier-protein] dehydratase
MRFALIDRIIEWEPGVRIVASKSLSMAEEYLGDHFPLFPVMPGVLMLQAMTEAGSWLVRGTENFAHSMVTLREVTNVKYAQFVEPGQSLVVTAEIVEHKPNETRLKTKGSVDGRTIVSCRMVLAQYNLTDTRPEFGSVDTSLVNHLRRQMRNLCRFSRRVNAEVAAEGAALNE